MQSDTLKLYGLIGHPLGHSFSRSFFNKKFRTESINADYKNFDIDDISFFPSIIKDFSSLTGLNVTIPYKTDIIPFLNELDHEAEAIGAVNVIKFIRKENHLHLIGYNSDVIGFTESILPLLNPTHKKALVLGTGGASKAIVRGLQNLGIEVLRVSRTPMLINTISYRDLTPDIIRNHTIIVNTTPLGMYPHIDECPPIPYDSIGPQHLCYDLIYNPEITLFLKNSLDRGAKIKNGMEMLILQALAAWNIWNK